MLRLKVKLTKRLVKNYDIIDGMTVGRDPSNDIQLLDKAVSRTHMRVNSVDGNVVLTDLGSANGVKVDGKKVSVHTLKEGETVKLGKKELFLEEGKDLPVDKDMVDLELLGFSREGVEEIIQRKRLGLVLPTDSALIEKAWKIGEKFLLLRDLPVEEHERLIIALREALGNAERHGNMGDRSKKIKLYLLDESDKVCMAVEDEGEGFDYQTVLEETRKKDAITAARERAAAGGHGGLGIRLMLKCVELIEYENSGCRIVMTKHKRPLTPEELEESKLTSEEEELKTSILRSINDSRLLSFPNEDDLEEPE